ncbi:hypothetical protein [uncultured Azohydromonas sp.]|jgi:hypothetical protein|uniref:hypothetical protein n=1 Tax=uncultured Azohydromonas sp. TaxID=487342 RepID=UPI0026343CA2|nr:hypothetical protein [uncultured Azohydromonas sp.]
MGDLYATDAALAEQAVADAFTHTRNDRTGSFAWEVAGCIAGLVLALLSAPAFSL